MILVCVPLRFVFDPTSRASLVRLRGCCSLVPDPDPLLALSLLQPASPTPLSCAVAAATACAAAAATTCVPISDPDPDPKVPVRLLLEHRARMLQQRCSHNPDPHLALPLLQQQPTSLTRIIKLRPYLRPQPPGCCVAAAGASCAAAAAETPTPSLSCRC